MVLTFWLQCPLTNTTFFGRDPLPSSIQRARGWISRVVTDFKLCVRQVEHFPSWVCLFWGSNPSTSHELLKP
jgi:hypothetical protein